jgi:serine recombinase
MKIGYSRVSTKDQDTQFQLNAFDLVGFERIYEEYQSIANTDRPVLLQSLKSLRARDKLIVCKLDRLGRRLQHLIETVTDLVNRQIVSSQSLMENINTPVRNRLKFFSWLTIYYNLYSSINFE